MRRLGRTKIICAVAGAALIVGLWVFFAPTKLGGSTTYTVTSGISMQPMLYKGDLALVRSQSTYHVGDVVLYESQVLHRPVLHRIILIQNGNYFFKGDNNGFVDPGYATRAELVGKLWFHIGGAGSVLSWFGKPAHAAPIAMVAVIAVVLTSSKTTKRKRRRRRRGTQTPNQQGEQLLVGEEVLTNSPEHPTDPERPNDPERPSRDRRSAPATTADGVAARNARPPGQDRRSGIAMTPEQLSARHAPTFLEGSTLTLVLMGVLLALALVFAGVGYARPLHKVTPQPGAYQQAGVFSYEAAVTAPTPVYPTGSVTTGQPIYPSLVKSVALHFNYLFSSALPHHIKGTIELKALLLSQSDTWQQLNTLEPTTAFNGDRASVVGSEPLGSLYSLITSVSTDSGAAGATYAADIEPIVHITGTVDGKPISATFSPVLPFTVTQTNITLSAAVAPALPGATYVAPSANNALASTVHPTQAGTIPHLVANEVTVAKYAIPVPALRMLGIVFGVLALVTAGFHDLARRRKTVRSDEELIAHRLHSLMVPVVTLAQPGGTIDVADFAHLAGLAQFLEQPILYEMRAGKRTYAVDDNAHRYTYRPSQDPDAAPLSAPRDAHVRSARNSDGSSTSRRTKRATLARLGAGLLALIVVGTVVTSFTASTNVPTSHVGDFVEHPPVFSTHPGGL